MIEGRKDSPALQIVNQGARVLKFFQCIEYNAFLEAQAALHLGIVPLSFHPQAHAYALERILSKINTSFQEQKIDQAEQIFQEAIKAFSEPFYSMILSEQMTIGYLGSQDASLRERGRKSLVEEELWLEKMIAFYKEHSKLAPIIYLAQKKKFLFYIFEGDFEKAAALVEGFSPFFDQIEDTKELTNLQGYLVWILLEESQTLGIDRVKRFATLFCIDCHPVIQAYKIFANCLEEISSIEHVKKSIQASLQLTQSLENEKISCPFWIQEARASLHFHAAVKYMELNHYHLAYQEFSSSEQLLEKNSINPQMLYSVRQQKEYLAKFLTKVNHE